MIKTKFLTNKDNTILKAVINLGDKNSKTLGHFPRSAYSEYAKKRKILVLLNKSNKLLGYILFDTVKTKDKVRIIHLCLDKEQRGNGYASRLLDELKSRFNYQFSKISLNCREDYTGANKFWKSYGFTQGLKKRSRSAKAERYLTNWYYTLDKQSLFSQLNENEDNKVEVLLDTNIFVKLREKDDKVLFLNSDWLDENINFCYSSELLEEINRDKDLTRHNDTIKYLSPYKEIRLCEKKFSQLENELEEIIKGSSENDISDRKQIATCILNDIEYFVTLDNPIHRKYEELEELYGLKVMSPSELLVRFDELENKDNYLPLKLAGAKYNIAKLGSDKYKALSDIFLESKEKKSILKAKIDIISSASNSELFTIEDSKKNDFALIAHIVKGKELSIPLLRQKVTKFSKTLFNQLIFNAIQNAISNNVHSVSISEEYIKDYQIEILEGYQFFQENGNWVKYCYQGIFDSKDLLNQIPELEKIVKYKGVDFNLMKSNSSVLLELEQALFPLKFKDLDIPTYIVPIKPHWANQLFDYISLNSELFSAKEENLIWNKDNVYYRNVNPNIEREHPARILWYASYQKGYNRSKSIVASSYLDDVQTDGAKSLFSRFKKFGIYKWDDIYGLAKENVETKIKALLFSNTEVFEDPIPLNKVQEIIGNKQSFQSPVKITNQDFAYIYSIGKNIKYYDEKNPTNLS